MKCRPRLQPQAVLHRGEPLLWLCCKMTCTFINWVIRVLHTSDNDVP